MKHYQIPKIKPNYPIGEDVADAVALVEEYWKAFKRIGLPKVKTINIWCRGSSGAILATLLATKLVSKYRVHISYVRKEGEKSHNAEPSYEMKGFNIVIDDFISLGTTMRAIEESMKSYEKNMKCDILMVSIGYEKMKVLRPDILISHVDPYHIERFQKDPTYKLLNPEIKCIHLI